MERINVTITDELAKMLNRLWIFWEDWFIPALLYVCLQGWAPCMFDINKFRLWFRPPSRVYSCWTTQASWWESPALLGCALWPTFRWDPQLNSLIWAFSISSLKLFLYSSRKQIWHPSTYSEQAWPLVLGRCISWSRLACRTACSRVSTAGIFCGRVWLWECGRSLASLHVSFNSIYAQLSPFVMILSIPYSPVVSVLLYLFCFFDWICQFSYPLC